MMTYILQRPMSFGEVITYWLRFALKWGGIGAGLFMLAFALWLASQVFAWSSEMPRGPFLGGPERVDPYSHPSHFPQLASAKKKISPAMRVFLNDQNREVSKENRMAVEEDRQERQRAKRLKRGGK